MPDDRDKTPAPRVRRQQTQTERDFDGLRARAEREQRTHGDQVDDLADAIGDATPEAVDWDEHVTKPHDIPDIGDLVLARYQSDPAYRALWTRVDHARADMRRSRRRTADQITEAIGAKPPNERLTKIETRLKIVWAILAAVGSVAAGAAVTVAKGLYERGETDGAHEIRLQQVERAAERDSQRLERLERDLIDGRRRGDQPDRPAFLQPPKGTVTP